MLPTIQAAIQICETYNIRWIENDFMKELMQTDYKYMSFTDHLEHFLNPEWTKENSFCMDGVKFFGSTEAYAGYSGLCFILNAKEKVYSSR